MRLVIFYSIINRNNKNKRYYYINFLNRDVYIKNLKGNGEEGGLFYTSNESSNVEFNAYNVTLHDLYQSDKLETSIIYNNTNSYVNMDGKINNDL